MCHLNNAIMRSYHKANRYISFYNNINFTRSLSNCIVMNISAFCTKQCINVIFADRKSDTSCSLYAIGNNVEHQPYLYLLYSLDLLITCGVPSCFKYWTPLLAVVIVLRRPGARQATRSVCGIFSEI